MSNLEIFDLAELLLKPFFTTLVALIGLSHIAYKVGLTDRPNARKQHHGEIPLIGGLAIYFCIAHVFLSQENPFPAAGAFFSSLTIIVITGLIDDYKNLDFKIRFAAEIMAALIMIRFAGVEITSLGNLLGFGEIRLGAFSTVFTAFAVVGGINAFNMIDGIDGLAGGTSLLVYLMLSCLCIYYGCEHSILLCLLLSASTLAFLAFNFPLPGRKQAWAFLGDTGSKLFGFTICWLVISASQGENAMISPVTALWLIATPILDSVCIILRRIRRGRSPFAPDREHFHHILIVAGYGKRLTLLIILSFALILGMIGIIGSNLLKLPDYLMFYMFVSLFAIYYWSMSHAWQMVKIARYLRGRKAERRRTKTRRIANVANLPFEDRRVGERRSGRDRRYQATAKDIAVYHSQSLLPVLITNGKEIRQDLASDYSNEKP